MSSSVAMKKDRNIKERVGNQNPFDVPTGYFEHLSDQIMSSLPERENETFSEVEEVSLWGRFKPWMYMAAMFIGAALIIRIASVHHQSTVVEPTYAFEEEISDDYLDISIEKAQMDDYSLYVYLTENGENQ